MNAVPVTAGIPLDPPSVRHGRFDIKVPNRRGGFDVIHVGWLPSEGWLCTACETSTRARPCVHVQLVKDTIGAQS